MRIGALVHARMSSSRLPGKVLRELAGTSVLGMLLDRLALAREVDVVAVATSDQPEDDPVAAFCEGRGTAVVRGPLDDLAGRMLIAAETLELDGFVRVNGDSPLLDPKLVDRAAATLRERDCDLATNVFPRSFPIGQSVEAITADAMREAVARIDDPRDREHVTTWFYGAPDRVRIESIRSDSGDWSEMSLAVDTAEDLANLEKVVARMSRPHTDYGWIEIAKLRAAL
jgi:spore coat polysaccharide biosynthesis protein SpsF